ncbi:MAG: aminotransferase class I/II, partial [Spirochaetia bacterium]|nr:aminotransferase class I/II [Spirochaetia bacterium]
YHQEKAAVVAKIKGRYMQVKKAVEAMPADVPLVAMPFNSGYFMTFVVKKIGAENLRKYLLEHYGIGTISIGEKFLRVAFSSVDINNIHDLFGTIFKAARELGR